MSASNSYRVVLIGEGGVGKSCLTIQFISEKFVEEYDPTLEDSYRKQVTVDDQECLLDIFDTAGQEDFSAVRDQYMRSGDGFLCAYSICAESTFSKVREFYDHVRRVKDMDVVPFVILGNKADMEKQRQISFDEANAVATELGVPFMETSAKTGQNVHEAFHTIVREIRKWREQFQEEDETFVTQKKKKTGFCTLL